MHGALALAHYIFNMFATEIFQGKNFQEWLLIREIREKFPPEKPAIQYSTARLK